MKATRRIACVMGVSAPRRSGAAWAIVATLALPASPARADEVRVMSSFAMAPAYLQLAAQFEQATGHKTVAVATATGVGSTFIPNRVRNGEPVDVIFQQISELLAVRGVDYVGPLPADVRRTTVLSAGIASKAGSPAAAKALVDFLASPAAQSVISETGLEPLRRR